MPIIAPPPETIADVLARLPEVPAGRIRIRPTPGTATEHDVIEANDHKGRLCELVDGVLVEKAMGFYESRVAIVLGFLLERFLETHPLGIVAGEAGIMRLAPGLVRIPDASFVNWSRLPGRQVPRDPIPELVPDLAVEVLSEGNTAAEMRRKVREYFSTGVRLVWLFQPETRSVEVHASLDRSTMLGEKDTLPGGDVLPGFSITVGEVYDRASGSAPAPTPL